MKSMTKMAALAALLAGTSAWADVTWTVNNTGGGDYTTIQAAFDALPATFTQNVTINVVNTGVSYGYAGLGSINPGAYRLTVRSTGGRALISTSVSSGNNYGLNLNGVPSVTVSGFAFFTALATTSITIGGYINTVADKVVISDNIFKRVTNSASAPDRVHAVALKTFDDNRGTIIERNYWRGWNGSQSLVYATTSGGYGGSPSDPLIIRNNIIEDGNLFNPWNNGGWGTSGNGAAYLLNNTVFGKGQLVAFGNHSGTDYSGMVLVNNLLAANGTGVTGVQLRESTKAPNVSFDYNLYSDSLQNIGTFNNGATVFTTLAAWRAALNGGSSSWDEQHSFTGNLSIFTLDTDDDPNDFVWPKGALPLNKGMPSDTVLPNGQTLQTMVGPVDYFGGTRISSGVIDIGAYEEPPPTGTTIYVR